MLLSPRFQKLHIDSLVVRHWMVFLKTRPSVKQNSTEFTNVSSFTLRLMCITHFTLAARILLFFLPTTNSFFKFVYSEITWESAWWVLFRPLSLMIEGHQNWTHFDSGLLISRTFLLHAGSSCTLLCLFLVSFTQKMCWRAHSLANIVPPFLTILQLLANSIRLLYFHVFFPVFPPFVYSCCVMDHTYHSHKSCPSTLAPLRHHSSRTLTSLFQALSFPF